MHNSYDNHLQSTIFTSTLLEKGGVSVRQSCGLPSAAAREALPDQLVGELATFHSGHGCEAYLRLCSLVRHLSWRHP